MIGCNYVITLPDGGEIEIPVDFGIIQVNEDLKESFKHLNPATARSFAEDLVTLTNGAIDVDLTENIVRENLTSLQDIVDVVNNEVIEGNTDYTTFETALSTYLGMEENNAVEILKKLESPITLKYFNNISKYGLVGSTNIKEQHLLIKNYVSSAKYEGFHTSLFSSIDTFLNFIKSRDPDLYESNVLLESRNAHGMESLNVETVDLDVYTMFEKGDYSTLFLGLFKRIGKNINEIVLENNFGDANFFDSSINEGGDIELSGFEKALVSKDPRQKTVINKAIRLVSTYLSRSGDFNMGQYNINPQGEEVKLANKSVFSEEKGFNPVLENTIQGLFIMLKPEIYVEESLKNKLSLDKAISNELKFEKDFKNKENNVLLLKASEGIDAHWSAPKVAGDQLYDFLIDNINVREDIILVPVGKNRVDYMVVTDIWQDGKNGVTVKGDRINRNGVMYSNTVRYVNGDTVYYRKRGIPKAPFVVGASYEANTETLEMSSNVPSSADLSKERNVSKDIKKKSHIETEVILEHIEIGDAVSEKAGTNLNDINGNRMIVVGINPGELIVTPASNMGKPLTAEDVGVMKLTDVRKMRSKRLKQLASTEIEIGNMKIENLNKYNIIENTKLISRGDLVGEVNEKTKKSTLKVVLATSDNSVFIYAGGKDKGFLKRIPRKNITDARSFTYNQVSLQEMETLEKEFLQQSGSNSKMSSFTDPHKAYTGDFFAYRKSVGGKEVTAYGKVIDSRVGKGVEWHNGDATNKQHIVDIHAVPNIEFYTNRKINAKYAIFTVKANSWKLAFTGSPNPSLNVKLAYMVPAGTDLSTLRLMPNNYANVGSYEDAAHVAKVNRELKKDLRKAENSVALIEKELKAATPENRASIEKRRNRAVKKVLDIENSIKVDATTEIKKLLEANGHDMTGKDIYAVKTQANNNHYARNTEGLNEIKHFNSLPTATKVDLDVIKPGVYFSVTKGTNLDYNIYRVENVYGDRVIAHYSKINSVGELLTFEKVFSMNALLATKSTEDAYAPEGSIYKLLVQHGNRKFEMLKDATRMGSKLTPNVLQEIRSINQLEGKLKNTFSQIGVKLVRSNDFSDGQKAKLESDKDGIVTIVLNDKDGTYSDIVHENLHIFLTLLRYSSESEYSSIIDMLITKNPDKSITEATRRKMLEANLYDKEEYAVNTLVSISKGEVDFLSDNLKTFMNTMAKTIRDSGMDRKFSVKDIDITYNTIGFLNSSLRDIYGVNKLDSSSDYYNMSLISFEPHFREWLRKEDIILKCT